MNRCWERGEEEEQDVRAETQSYLQVFRHRLQVQSYFSHRDFERKLPLWQWSETCGWKREGREESIIREMDGERKKRMKE